MNDADEMVKIVINFGVTPYGSADVHKDNASRLSLIYIVGILFPILVHALFVFIVIEANTGNGSWVGLGAFLLGMFAIPATAITNFIYIRRNKGRSGVGVILRCFALALVIPILMLFLLAIG